MFNIFGNKTDFSKMSTKQLCNLTDAQLTEYTNQQARPMREALAALSPLGREFLGKYPSHVENGYSDSMSGVEWTVAIRPIFEDREAYSAERAKLDPSVLSNAKSVSDSTADIFFNECYQASVAFHSASQHASSVDQDNHDEMINEIRRSAVAANAIDLAKRHPIIAGYIGASLVSSFFKK